MSLLNKVTIAALSIFIQGAPIILGAWLSVLLIDWLKSDAEAQRCFDRADEYQRLGQAIPDGMTCAVPMALTNAIIPTVVVLVLVLALTVVRDRIEKANESPAGPTLAEVEKRLSEKIDKVAVNQLDAMRALVIAHAIGEATTTNDSSAPGTVPAWRRALARLLGHLSAQLVKGGGRGKRGPADAPPHDALPRRTV